MLIFHFMSSTVNRASQFRRISFGDFLKWPDFKPLSCQTQSSASNWVKPREFAKRLFAVIRHWPSRLPLTSTNADQTLFGRGVW